MTEVGVIPTDWEVRRLGDLMEFKNGKAHEQFISDLGDYIVVNSKFISTSGEVYKNSDLCISPLNKGEIVMVMSDIPNGKALAKCFIIPMDGIYTLNQRICSLSSTTGDNSFFAKILNRNKYFLSFDSGTGQTNLKKDEVLDCPIPLPPTLSEQTAIATALGDADALLQSLEKLIAKKRRVKQGAMQELLRKKEGWELKQLGEMGDKFLSGGTPSTQKAEYWKGNIPWISGADVIGQEIPHIRRFISREAVERSPTNIIEKGNLLIVTRTGVGKLAIAPFDLTISQDMTGVYLKKEEMLPEFLFHYFDFNKNMLRELVQGTSIAGLTKETLLELEIPLPPKPEQTRIARILSDMDGEIAALEAKLAKHRAVKAGMMQELLTGRVRLV